jgi:hypothetical protein
VTVDYATSDGTATAGNDYNAANGTLHFAAGETQKSFAIPILTDALKEGPEKWEWGYRLGNSPAFDHSNNWQDFAGGGLPYGEFEFAVALKADGSLWLARAPDFVARRVATDNDWGSPP